jgi:hypothetical protein
VLSILKWKKDRLRYFGGNIILNSTHNTHVKEYQITNVIREMEVVCQRGPNCSECITGLSGFCHVKICELLTQLEIRGCVDFGAKTGEVIC